MAEAETRNHEPPPPRQAPAGSNVLFYDGVCALCNGLVRFVLARDDERSWRFAPLQSHFAEEVLSPLGLDPHALSTVYVVTAFATPGQEVARKARAALQVVRSLGGPWRLLGALAWLPTALLDAMYDAVAATRYRLFGRYETCPLPAAEHRDRFIGFEVS